MVGAAFTTTLKIIFKGIRALVEILADVIFYFGLYVPILYLIYGAVLHGVFRFELFNLTTDSKLFIFGFAICIAASLLISVKNLIVKPYKRFFKKTHIIEYKNDKKLARDVPEAPKIYKSKVNPGVIVYEYSNRYDLYEEIDGGLEKVETEYKTRKEKRW